LHLIYLKTIDLIATGSLRATGLYKRFKKLKASKELTQVVTTKPDFKGLD
jgi:hypothetical protein